MEWAPDSPDLWAPDSATPNRWAPDSGGHLTLGRAVDLFLAAKAAEGAAAKTLEWYGMILHRAIRGLGEERPVEQLAGPELRAGSSSSARRCRQSASPATSGRSRCSATGWRPRSSPRPRRCGRSASRASPTSSSSRSATMRCGGSSGSPTSATGRSSLAIRALIEPEGFRYSSLTQIPSIWISGV
jgi:hypothetical protein